MLDLKQLKESETGQRTIYQANFDALVIVGENSLIAYVNPTAENIFGYNINEMIGQNISMLLHENKKLENKELDEQSVLFAPNTLKQNKVVEGFRKDGSKFSLEVNVAPMDINGLRSFVCVFRDIGEHKLVNNELTETSRLLDSIVENVPNMIFLKRASDLRFEFFNRAGEELLGLDRAELLGRNDYDFFPKEQADFFTGKDREVLRQKGVVDIPEESIETPSGTRILHTKKITLRDEQGQPQYLLGISEDITENKRFERELSKRKAEFEVMYNAIPDAVMFADTERRIVMNNPAVIEMFGYSNEELIGNTTEMLYADIKDFVDQGRLRFNKGVDGSPGSYEVRYKRKDGHTFWTESRGTKVINSAGEVIGFLGVFRDITESRKIRKELERHQIKLEELVEERTQELRDAQDELVRKERLATLGQLTATVSHELRNPLGAMRPSLYVIEKRSDKKDERIQQAIERLDTNIDRCDQIIEELLDFTRITKLDKQSTRIDEWLESVINEQEFPADIQVEKKFTLKNIDLAVDTSRLRRAVINIMENACHAILDDKNLGPNKKGPHLSIKTKGSDKRIEIIISDTGTGIAENVLGKIFEPLFSTKGFGVGLGMSTVKQIMQQHDGGIEIETKVDYGTAITLWLPR